MPGPTKPKDAGQHLNQQSYKVSPIRSDLKCLGVLQAVQCSSPARPAVNIISSGELTKPSLPVSAALRGKRSDERDVEVDEQIKTPARGQVSRWFLKGRVNIHIGATAFAVIGRI
jgi:hypothetical protein